jgi:hydrogenase maturation factor HypF (carbamoyltransferase family)
MVLGEDERLTDAVRDDFQRSGLAHILAVSGQNVVLLIVLVLGACALLGVPLRTRLVLAAAVVVLYVPLAGGDASVERPYRMALSHLRAAGIEWADDLPPVLACPADERAVLAHQLSTGFGCVSTSSMGRLFDAVASLTGVRQVAAYEAAAAMALESVADSTTGAGDYRFDLCHGANGALAVQPAGILAAVVRDLRAGESVAGIASRFHSATADMVVAVARQVREAEEDARGLSTVALGGGVFQNARLLGECVRGLEAEGFEVLVPTRVPPNDGGIALGQILVATNMTDVAEVRALGRVEQRALVAAGVASKDLTGRFEKEPRIRNQPRD